MGIQSNIISALGTVSGAKISVAKTLQKRQEEANKKAKERLEAKSKQKQNYRKPKGILALYGGQDG